MILFLVLGALFSNLCAQKAFISVPVADLVSSPLYSHITYKKFLNPYNHLPLCPTNLYTSTICPRLHQLLFNEIVHVLETTTHEAKVEIKSAFFINSTGKKITIYWTNKKNLTYFSELEHQNIASSCIPATVNSTFSKTIALTKPIYNATFNATFSAGTRFVCTQQPSLSTYEVYAYNPRRKKLEIITIPKDACIVPTNDPTQQRALFLKLVKQWAYMQGYIPYTWGGTSFTSQAYQPFKVTTYKISPETFYTYPHYLSQQTKTGFDCAGIILRAAQTVGIPYWYKNTRTLSHYLSPVKPHDQLKEGDLVWIPGHVMIISNIACNRLIEARFYEHDYGYVHEIELSKVFEGITNYKDLRHAIYNNQPLRRLDKHGKKKELFRQAKLLKLI